MADSYSLNKDAKALEDAFFAEQNRKLLEQLQERARTAERRAVLKAALELDDDALIDRLVELDMNVESVVAFGLVPLVEVAWADGEIQSAERKAILDALASKGAEPGGIAYRLVENWLSHKPEPQLLETWRHYAAAIGEALEPARRDALKRAILDQTRAVAESAGGFLGLGSKISDAEQAVLDELEWAFGE
jgi:hypothetical protein